MRALRETIAAISTARGVGGISIVRVSGKLARHILRNAFRPSILRAEYESHRMYYGHAVGGSGEILDEVMAVIMVAPHSYTREDVLELHCHGGDLCAAAVLGRALELGARAAAPGEFTKRAFLSGRIDLSRAEAVMQLIGARSEWARRSSLRQLGGGTSAFVRSVSERLTDLLSMVEAATDFPEEIDEPLVAGAVCEAALGIACEIARRIDRRGARLIRDGASVVLAGRPNVGKSSLMNALLQSERAIVTDIPGTTRDVLTERLSVNGIAVELSDTAGIRHTGDHIEKIGVDRARGAVDGADIVLLVLDVSESLTDEDRALLARADARHILCLNKLDLPAALVQAELPPLDTVRLSATSGAGVGELLSLIGRRLEISGAEADLFTVERHMQLARDAEGHLRDCAKALQAGIAVDAASDDLWRARRLLSEITGVDASGDVIDAIFRNFCVGK